VQGWGQGEQCAEGVGGGGGGAGAEAVRAATGVARLRARRRAGPRAAGGTPDCWLLVGPPVTFDKAALAYRRRGRRWFVAGEPCDALIGRPRKLVYFIAGTVKNTQRNRGGSARERWADG